MSRKIPFTNIQEIEKNRKNRSIVLFATGRIAEKTYRLLKGKPISSVVDNAKNLWGEQCEFDNEIEIQNPEILLKRKNEYIIICTTSFVEVSNQLEKMGFKSNIDFCVSPILNDLRIIDELETIDKKILFTSGSPKQDSAEYGGGIYELIVKGDKWEHKKVISGNCYGMIKYGKNFIAVDNTIGIFEFDKKYNILRSKELPKGIAPHGISFSEKKENFYVVGSYIDGVLELDKDFNVIDRIIFSDKLEDRQSPQHHCNDCCIFGNSLFVSMFSYTGNWKLDIFDGVILEIDIQRKKILQPIVKDLWMPHNVKIINGGIVVLESLRGQLRKNNVQIIGEFPAFTRGLAYDGVYYYIGQSRNRNFTKNLGVSKNISIDAGIIIWDEYTKVSRFLQLPPKISEIHSIVLVD